MTVSVVADLLSMACGEVLKFACAAAVFLVFSRRVTSRKTPGKPRAAESISKNHKRVTEAVVGANAGQNSALQSVAQALRRGDLEKAMSLISQMPTSESSSALRVVAPQFLSLAAKSSDSKKTVSALDSLPLSEASAALDVAVTEAFQRKDLGLVRRLYHLSRMHSIPTLPITAESFAKVFSSDSGILRALVEEAGVPLYKSLAKSVLEACAALKDADLALEVFERVSESDSAELRAFAEMKAAAAESVVQTDYSPTFTRKVRARGKDGDLKGAIALFEKALQSTPQSSKSTTFLFNSIIEACVECRDVERARSYLLRAQKRTTVDAVSFNLLMKGYLAASQVDAAAEILVDLEKSGLQPTEASYHGLLKAHMSVGDCQRAWNVLEQMQAAGVKPNAVSFSILLKGVSGKVHAAQLPRVMKLIHTSDCSMDEVLLSSLVEACLGVGRLDLLEEAMKANARRGDCAVALTAPSYGSMIKAFGRSRDWRGVWRLWKEMGDRGVEPTETTLGCMVEALVANRQIDDAWQLVRQIWDTKSRKHLVNTVTYSTLLKGLVRQPVQVMQMYEEMRARGIPCNLITYNTILNAFAYNGAMNRVPKILEDMKTATPPIEPDLVTYSTLIKGFCSSGDLSRALELLEVVKRDGKYSPDEVVYNSLIDGCAKERRADDAIKLVDEMRAVGVVPSNYTLSTLVKCLGRCKKLGQAFSMIEAITQDFGFRPNIQVYTCLIQACFQNRKPTRALPLLDQLVEQGLRPDEKLYTVLVQGCLHAGLTEKAVQIVRQAYQGAVPVSIDARSLEEVMARLGGAQSEAARTLHAEIDAGCRRWAEQENAIRTKDHPQERRFGGTERRVVSGSKGLAKCITDTISTCSTSTGAGRSSGSDCSS